MFNPGPYLSSGSDLWRGGEGLRSTSAGSSFRVDSATHSNPFLHIQTRHVKTTGVPPILIVQQLQLLLLIVFFSSNMVNK